MVPFRRYKIVGYSGINNTVDVLFIESSIIRTIDIPIVDGKYVVGEQLENYILTFLPVSQEHVNFNLKVSNFKEIESLVDTDGLEEILYLKNKNELLSRRLSLLKATDWTQLPDAQEIMDEQDKKMFKEYRQKLRDITKQEKWPSEVDWPKYPHVLGVYIF